MSERLWPRAWPWLCVAVPPLILYAPFLLGLRVLYWGTPLLQFYPWRKLAFDLMRAGQWPLWNPYLGNGAPLLANLQSAVFYPPNWLGLLLPLEYSFSWLVALHWIWAGAGMVALARALGLKPLGQAVAGLAFGLCQYLVARAWFFSINATVAWLPWVIWAGDRALVSYGEGRRWARYAWLLALCVAMQLLAGHAQTAWYTLLLLAAWALWRSTQLASHSGRSQRPEETPGDKSPGYERRPINGAKGKPGLAGLTRSGRRFQRGQFMPARAESAAGLMKGDPANKMPSSESAGSVTLRRAQRAEGSLLPVKRRCRPAAAAAARLSVTEMPSLAALLLPLIVAAALAALQLLPTAELLRQSTRASAADYEFVMTYSFSPWRFLTLLAPDLLGNPARGQFYGYGNYWEDAVYVGVLPLLLAAWAVWRAARRWGARALGAAMPPQAAAPPRLVLFLTLVLLVTPVLALGRNTAVFPFLYRYVPTFDLFQAPARMMVWVEFALALLAGIGAGQLGPPGDRAKRWARLAAAGSVSLALTGLVSLAVIPAQTALGQQFQTVARALATLGVTLFITFVLLLARPRAADDSMSVFRWQALVMVFIAADLLYAGWGLSPGAAPGLYGAPSASAEAVRNALGGHRLFAFPGDDATVKYNNFLSFQNFGPSALAAETRAAEVSNASLLDGLPSSNNYEPLVSARYAGFIDVITTTNVGGLLNLMDVSVLASGENQPLKVAATGGPVTFFRWPGAPSPVRVVYSATAVLDAQVAEEEVADPAFDPESRVILETEDADPAAAAAPASPLLPSANGPTYAVSLREAGWVVVSDTCYPGWVAYVDGQPAPVRCGDLAFFAVAAPAGDHTVTFRYQPLSFAVGLWVSAVAWVAFAAAGWWVWRKRT